MSKQDSRRPLKFNDLHASVTEAYRLNATGYTMTGSWDLASICQHLSKTLRMSLEGAPFSLPFFLKPIARTILFRTVMNGQPTRLSLKTAPPFRPEDVAGETTEIANYERLTQQVISDDASLLPDHPVFGRVTKDEWRQFHAWHAAHHFSFLIPNTASHSGSAASQTPQGTHATET